MEFNLQEGGVLKFKSLISPQPRPKKFSLKPTSISSLYKISDQIISLQKNLDNSTSSNVMRMRRPYLSSAGSSLNVATPNNLSKKQVYVKACSRCRDLHRSCDTNRPCKNCVKQNFDCNDLPAIKKRLMSDNVTCEKNVKKFNSFTVEDILSNSTGKSEQIQKLEINNRDTNNMTDNENCISDFKDCQD